jgi:hypothetical protein
MYSYRVFQPTGNDSQVSKSVGGYRAPTNTLRRQGLHEGVRILSLSDDPNQYCWTSTRTQSVSHDLLKRAKSLRVTFTI